MTGGISTPPEFWASVVCPDLEDFESKQNDLRLAFHCATSLFHLSDWIYVQHKTAIDASFQWDDGGTLKPVKNEKQFASALANGHPDFELIRRIANTAKHLKLTGKSSHPDAPSHAANTRPQSTGWGEGGFGSGPYGGSERVMIETDVGKPDLEFLDVAQSVRDMWLSLNALHKWW